MASKLLLLGHRGGGGGQGGGGGGAEGGEGEGNEDEDANERWLWHGSRAVDPDEICKSGHDFRWKFIIFFCIWHLIK